MKTKILARVLGALITIPCMLCAEEAEILLTEVIAMETIEGENPLDNPDKERTVPTRLRDFRATIDGHFLRVIKQAEEIPLAQVSIVNASTGGLVSSMPIITGDHQINTSDLPNGVYYFVVRDANYRDMKKVIIQH